MFNFLDLNNRPRLSCLSFDLNTIEIPTKYRFTVLRHNKNVFETELANFLISSHAEPISKHSCSF